MNGQFEQLSCQELVELVTDYLEGMLLEEERLRFDEHIGRCDGCDVYLEQMRLTVSMLGHVPKDALSPEAEQELLAAFRGWRAS
ncbi:MAG TPA: zf-HC2 domain-containing protein [Gaiellaceae bacterium]|jgi:anti-sigma factor RsiW|nr:zf-HC2 domain-containing protein [Gaiellaceae bacterium]